MAILGTAPLGISLPNDVFLSHAEWWNENSRFVLVRFRRRGEMMDLGLRFDLDKLTFLDDTGDPEADQVLQSTSSRISEAVFDTKAA
ncbi:MULTISPECIES: hypothetical protein [Methylobacterium]|uniref:Uncharacterized protein n=2 Tax=Methylobacterium TaxID=407 RepID=A0A0C6FE56_9HYPH|nr:MULTISPECIES: hypothetical protein [Methylobacterium]BAQ46838.1 hypothetical protein Maq22A_c18775 [Methylobacterium aquaticum]